MAYEYFLKFWGGATPTIERDLGIKAGHYYFLTKQEKDDFKRKIKEYSHLGLAYTEKEGELSHKRTVAVVEAKYKDKTYNFEYDFGYEYEEEVAYFMFEDGNYSCDCNLSRFIQDIDPEFPKLDCGDEIEYNKLEIEFRD